MNSKSANNSDSKISGGLSPFNRTDPRKNPGIPAVPPVLREVGKLAAGVASVITSGGIGAVSGLSNTGSATGNPRNKCALQPGHSLMDWIRLGSSGKDLTGVGQRAGQLSVTPADLALHNKENDAWLAINGKVFNVTEYLSFHPGGAEELMKGVGQNATKLFEDVHPWVNYEQILQKCYIGRLVRASDTDVQPEWFRTPKIPAPNQDKEQNRPNSTSILKESAVSGSSTSGTVSTSTTTPTPSRLPNTEDVLTKEPISLPKFDWIQKLDYITIIFYTGSFFNPLIEINQISPDTYAIFITTDRTAFDNEIKFLSNVEWPGQIKVVWETGKIEVVFKKREGRIWENYGILKQGSKPTSAAFEAQQIKCVITNKIMINYNTFLIELERLNSNEDSNGRCKVVVPLGKHVRVFDKIQDVALSRSYTPVSDCLFHKYRPQAFTTDNVCLMVKRYEEGNISKSLCDKKIGDVVMISKPLGTFDLKLIEKRENFIILAAGTGITPMLSVILFLLERRIRKCQFLRLLFFNRTPQDILLKDQFEALQKEDLRFKVQHILSQGDQSWSGLQGHITKPFLESTIADHLADTTYTQKDLFIMVCGPTPFTNLAHRFLTDLGFDDNQMHLFLG